MYQNWQLALATGILVAVVVFFYLAFEEKKWRGTPILKPSPRWGPSIAALFFGGMSTIITCAILARIYEWPVK